MCPQTTRDYVTDDIIHTFQQRASFADQKDNFFFVTVISARAENKRLCF